MEKNMAQQFSLEQLQQLQVKNYSQLRQELKSGDLVFTSGNYFISQAIRKVTNSPWSHVGIVFYLNDIDRVLLLESVESSGVRFAPLSKYVGDYKNGEPYDGIIAVARHRSMSDLALTTMAKFGISELTRPYDKDEVGKILSRLILGKGKWESDREYICSELVYECYKKAGIALNHNPLGFVSPADIWQDAAVELVARIQ